MVGDSEIRGGKIQKNSSSWIYVTISGWFCLSHWSSSCVADSESDTHWQYSAFKLSNIQLWWHKPYCKFAVAISLDGITWTSWASIETLLKPCPWNPSIKWFFFKVHSAPHPSHPYPSISQQNDKPYYLAKENFFLSYRKYTTVMFHSRPSSRDRCRHSSGWMRRSKKYLVYNTFRTWSL